MTKPIKGLISFIQLISQTTKEFLIPFINNSSHQIHEIVAHQLIEYHLNMQGVQTCKLMTSVQSNLICSTMKVL